MGKSMVSGVDFPLNQSIDCPKILKPTRRKSMEKPMYQWWKRDQWWFRWAFQRLAQRYPWFGTGTSPASSPSNPSNPSILVTTMPPWKVPGNLKLIFSSEVQSPAQVDQVVPIVQMLQRQMQQTQLHLQHPEVQAPQVKDVKEPKEPSDTGNRTRGTPLEPMVTVVVKNIPLHYSQDMFMDQVKKHGFEGLFNLLYLPWNSKSDTNKGLGFLNFIHPDDAQRFQKDMEGKYFDEDHTQSRACRCGLPIEIERADVQGLKSNRARFNKKSHRAPWLSPTKPMVPLLEIGQWAGIPRRRKEGLAADPLVKA